MKRLITGLVTLLLISGCATSYQPKGLGGGYSETQLRQDIYRVRFLGNGYTSEERAVDFTLLRCAELALESGYPYFLIFSESLSAAKAAATIPATANASSTVSGSGNYIAGKATSTIYDGQVFVFEFPRTLNSILLLSDAGAVDGMAYDARSILNSIRKKYHLSPARDYSSYRVDASSDSNSRSSGTGWELQTYPSTPANSRRSRRIEYADNREYDDGVSEMGKIFRVTTTKPDSE